MDIDEPITCKHDTLWVDCAACTEIEALRAELHKAQQEKEYFENSFKSVRSERDGFEGLIRALRQYKKGDVITIPSCTEDEFWSLLEVSAPVPAMPMQDDSDLSYHLERVRKWGIENTGNEPSVSCFHRAVDELSDFIKAMPIPKQETAGAVPDGLNELIAACRQIGFPVVSDGMKSVIDDMQSALRRVQASIGNPSPRITEQDAREIIKTWGAFNQEVFEIWLESTGRALLNKLNANAVAEVRKEPVAYCRDGDLDREDFVAITEPHELYPVKLFAGPQPAQAAAIPEFHMSEAMSIFNALKIEQVSRRVINSELGSMGATAVTTWTSKVGGLLEIYESNGGITLKVLSASPKPE